MMSKNSIKLPEKHRNGRFSWKRLFTFLAKISCKKKFVSKNEEKCIENCVKSGVQCTQDHDSDTVLFLLMKKISNAEGIYDYDQNILLQNLRNKAAGLMESDPIHSRLTRSRVHHSVELSQKVYDVCTQDHEVDATYRQVTNNMNVFDYPLKTVFKDHCAGCKLGTNPPEKQTHVGLHGANHSKLTIRRFNSCPLLEERMMEKNNCASICDSVQIVDSIPSVVMVDGIKGLHDVDESVTNLDLDSSLLAKLDMESSVKVADDFTNLDRNFTIDNSDTLHSGHFHKSNYKMQDTPTHDLKADEMSSVKLTKFVDDLPDPIDHRVRKRIANPKNRNHIYNHFLKFENFSRCTMKSAVQMMSASEYCHPRYSEEEKRKITLQGMTDLQLFGFERQELAHTGWFYNHQVLVTFCCGMEMPVSPSGSPIDVHLALSPQCLFAQSLQNKRQSELSTVHRRETENQNHLSSPVQCSDDNEAVSLSVEEYLVYSSLGLFHPALRESVPGEHWVMDRSYASSTSAARIDSATDEHDSLVTNRTPLPSEEFQPFVSDNSQPRDGGRTRNTLQPSHERIGTDQARHAQATVGQLSMRAGGEDTLSMASVLQGLQQSAGSQSLQPAFVADQINMDGMRGDGYRARYPQFSFPTVRIWTYEGWPSNYKQTPSMLADAGFFYAGYGDCVLCYCCGIGVRFWKPADDPWIEHARLQQSCTFMQVMQGQYFIEAAVALSRDGGHPTYKDVRIEANRRQRADETEEEIPGSPVPGAVGDTLMLCKVCFSREMSVVLMPCRHLAVCIRCSGRISSCPLCHKHIESTFQASF